MKFEDLFRIYEPPPGGLEDLRGRLASLPARRRRNLLLRGAGTALATAAGILVAILVWNPWPEDPFSRSLSRSGGEALWEASGPEVSVPPSARSNTAILRVPTTKSGVSFYWVVKTDGP